MNKEQRLLLILAAVQFCHIIDFMIIMPLGKKIMAEFSIEPGQFVGVIGRSGAGKSTMLRLINRLIDPTSGSISFGGTEITALKGKALREWRRDCAMFMIQSAGL